MYISMPGYVKDSLHKFQNPTPTRPQHSPHKWTAPQYRSTAPQMVHPTDNYLVLNPDEANNVQQIVGTILYYGRAVDLTMLVALNTIAAEKSKIAQEKAVKVVQLINYIATQPEAITRYRFSGITLHMNSNVSFLSAPGSNIITGGYQYLSEPSSDPKKPPHKPPPLNGPIHVKCTIMKNFLASAMEAELGALFVNFQLGAALRISLE